MGAVEKSDRLCVFDSLTAVGLNDLADDVASGNNTPLTREFHNDGIVLSGGQRQKIAISRLLAREYDIAVLDEPSASLDPISEKKVIDELLKITKQKTILLISHRLSIAKKMDTIIFLENGRIVEKGSHQELMDLEGKYAAMYKLQAQSYQ